MLLCVAHMQTDYHLKLQLVKTSLYKDKGTDVDTRSWSCQGVVL